MLSWESPPLAVGSCHAAWCGWQGRREEVQMPARKSKQTCQLPSTPKSTLAREQVNVHWTVTLPLPAPGGRIALKGRQPTFNRATAPH